MGHATIPGRNGPDMRFLTCLLLLPAILPAQTGAAGREIYVVPFSHLDLYWGGTQEECLSRGIRIINRAVQLAEKYPEFRFLLEDDVFAANFVDAMKGAPELDAFRRLVKEGRIEIAPKWAGIYQNLPRGEALLRNVVYGKRFARDVFGVDPQVAHLGDIPGFTRQYPQILAKSGVPYMVMTRMGPPDTSLFRWKSPDGSSVLLWNTIKGYGWGVGLGLHRDLDDARFAKIAGDIQAVGATSHGPIYLGWGTDLWAPNEKLVENMAVLNRRFAPDRFRLATAVEYFRAAAKSPGIPEIGGEIPSSWANVISSMSHLWPPVITATDTLLNAEKFAAINDALGYAAYPRQQLDSLWTKALEAMDHNNFGQGVDIGDERKVGYAQAAILQGGQILRESLRNIAERVQHPMARAMAIVVFNPLNWTRDDAVRAHVTLYGDVGPGDLADYKKAMRLVDAVGNSVPFQVEEYTENISRALDVVFTARAVPSLGYKTYYLIPAEKAHVFPPASTLKMDTDNDARNARRVIGANVLENEFYRLTVDRATGRIEVFDKELNRAIAKDVEIAAVEERGGNTLSVEPATGRTLVNVINAVDLEENSPARTVMRIAGDVAGVPIVQRVILYQGLKRIDLENTVTWKPGRFLKIEQVFPLEQRNAEIRNGVPFGSAATAEIMPNSGPHQGDEVPREIWKGWRQIQDWIAASTPEWTLTIGADHQMFTATDICIRGGMLRGTRFNPLNVIRDGKTVLVQQPPAGTYVYRYSITSAKGDWAAAKSWRAGMQFNTPLIPVEAVDELGKKPLPPELSFLTLQGDNLVVSALKKADRGEGVVARVFDVLGLGGETPVRFLSREGRFQPVNMLEEPVPGGEQTSLRLRPYEISTIKLRVP
jgi:alpha-mannosidase